MGMIKNLKSKKALAKYSGFTKVIFILATVLTIFVIINSPAKNSVTNDKRDDKTSLNTIKSTPENVHVNTEMKNDTILVTRVIDGDTIEIEGGYRVRYIGIDTPESVNPNTPIECFAVEASKKNQELVGDKYVRLEKDVSETDRYGRLLRYVWVGDIFVNDYLVRQGYANSSTYPPNVKYQDQFKQAENEARSALRGLWSNCQSPTTVNPAPQPTTSVTQGTSLSSCVIKGNISGTGEKIYHVPGCASYNATKIDESRGERWFCSEDEAVSAGWRKAKNC